MPSLKAARAELSFVPLDNRPCCCQFVERLGQIASTDLRLPPPNLLGDLHRPGDCQALLDWLESQNTERVLASLDMLCWGGLVASRQAHWPLEPALERLAQFSDLERELYATMSLLRTAPTQTSQQEVELAEQIVELSVWAARRHRGLEGAESRYRELESRIPDEMLQKYLATRQRNLRYNQAAAAAAASDRWQALLLGIDDSKTEGWNLLELEQLQEHPQLFVAPGTDESSQLLLARILAAGVEIAVETSEPDTPRRHTIYEDRCLGLLIEAQMKAAAIELNNEARRRLFVFGPGEPQLEAPNQPPENPRVEPFVKRLQAVLEQGYLVAVADVCHANGADRCLARALIESGVAAQLVGYAAWNTAGNALGTALATLALAPEQADAAQLKARQDFLLERLADDYLYQSEFRQQLRRQFGPGYALDDKEARLAEERLGEMLEPEVCRLGHLLFGRRLSPSISLPWRRLFEAQILV